MHVGSKKDESGDKQQSVVLHNPLCWAKVHGGPGPTTARSSPVAVAREGPFLGGFSRFRSTFLVDV